MKNPEVRINFSWLFYERESKQLNKLNDWKLSTGEEYEELTEAYRVAWAAKEKAILSGIQEVTDLKFYKNVIDITTAADVIPKSDPLLISFVDTPDTVVDTIAHELTHTLLCDNTILSIYGPNRNFKLGSEWRKLFGFEDDFSALVHVPVFAVLQKVFVDKLGDNEFPKRDKELMKKWGADSYVKAWDYVEKEGADVIIEKLKESYAEIAKKLEKKK